MDNILHMKYYLPVHKTYRHIIHIFCIGIISSTYISNITQREVNIFIICIQGQHHSIMTPTSGRVAVVTGANKGIGFFIALQLGASGLFQHVILACRDPVRGQAAVTKIAGSTGNKASISCLPLTLGDVDSHEDLRESLEKQFGKVDCLVNNAAMAYKGADPTPFVEQCTPTLDINFRGTVDLTEKLLPLVKKGSDARIVNVASMSGHLNQIKSKELKDQFRSSSLTMPALKTLVIKFEMDVKSGQHLNQGWGNSNYGMSKLAVIAATKVWANENPEIKINCCCPGYCKTDMTSQNGARNPSDGARNAVLPATMENPPTGELFANFEVSSW